MIYEMANNGTGSFWDNINKEKQHSYNILQNLLKKSTGYTISFP